MQADNARSNHAQDPVPVSVRPRHASRKRPPQEESRKKPSRLVRKLLPPLLILLFTAAIALGIRGILSTPLQLVLYLNQRPVGVVTDMQTASNALYALHHDISAAVGEQVSLDCAISYRLKHTRSTALLSYDDCYSLLYDAASDRFVCAFALRVDGVIVGANRSEDELLALIETMKTNTQTPSETELLNDITVSYQLCLRDQIKSIEELGAILNADPSGQTQKKPAVRFFGTDVSLPGINSYVPSLSPLYQEASRFKDELSDQLQVSVHSYTYDSFVNSGVDFGIPRTEQSADSADTAASPALPSKAASLMSDTPLLTVSPSAAPDIRYAEYYIEQTVEDIPAKTEYVYSGDYYNDTRIVTRLPVNGKLAITWRIGFVDGEEVIRIASSTVIQEQPVNRIITVGTKERPKPLPTGSFLWPSDAYRGVSSYFGSRALFDEVDYHLGIDIPGAAGDSVYASDGGTVIFAGYNGSYGLCITISHGNSGYVTHYAHLSAVNVSYGDRVFQGQVIGAVGATGRASGPHLHFEIRYLGNYLNPLSLLP